MWDGIITKPEKAAEPDPKQDLSGGSAVERQSLGQRGFSVANPSLKNGYLSIATELVEQFAKINIPGGEMRIIWVVWRKTWGWKDGDRKKDWDWIAISQFEEMTGMKHANVVRELKSLVVKRILLKSENGFKFNQNYDDWVVSKRIPPVVKRILGSSQKDTKIGSQKDTNNRYKETNTKEITSTEQSSEHTGTVINLFKELNPSYQILFKRKPQHDAARRLLDREGLERITRAVEFIQSRKEDRFCPAVTTPIQLEEKWGLLEKYGAGLKGSLKTNNQPKWKVWN